MEHKMDPYNELCNTCSRFPEKLAICHKGEKITFSELKARVERFTRIFKNFGIERGERVVIYMPNSPQYIYALLASLCYGTVAVPLDQSFKKADLENIIRHADAKYIVSENEIDLSSTTIKKQIKAIDRLTSEGDEQENIETTNEDDLCIILYTSGTTGEQKAVPLTYRHLSSPVSTIKFFNIDEDMERIICHVPFSHIGGFVYILSAVSFGSTLFIGESFKPGRFLQEVDENRITLLWIPPSVLNAALRTETSKRVLLSSLRLLVYFGAPAGPDLLKEVEKRFPSVNAITGWGLTETAAPNVIIPKDTPAEKKYAEGIVGKPCPWVKIKIIDEQSNSLPPGEHGEILIKGWCVMDGYYKNAELTSEVLKDGWFYTGDIGFMDRDGFLYISGRKKDVIIVGGMNVNAGDVEQVILCHPVVKDVAVIGAPDTLRGEAVKAVIVTKDGMPIDQKEIISFCKKKLPSYSIPKLIEFRDNLPMTPSGKIKKSLLK
jgi:acyl-CoA synthetase (AMP-forming)/AMP-acid ligase II